jgi:uncharacterized membrane protein YqhA
MGQLFEVLAAAPWYVDVFAVLFGLAGLLVASLVLIIVVASVREAFIEAIRHDSRYLSEQESIELEKLHAEYEERERIMKWGQQSI